MGNIASCFYVQSNTAAKLIDLRLNVLRLVDAPVTAAELMFEEPGCVVSPLNDFRRDSRLSAMKADENICSDRVYLLIPISRVNGKVSGSEMAVIESVCGESRAKRRSSKVLPVVRQISGDRTENSVKLSGEGRVNYRMPQWKPALEPIYEGI